ncbi:helix-turn-helix domain-containing protein [Thermogymnomonas acidicola]|nr:helix-turn-helix domain-containing protein [Thermogymnomonas acidicola]
MALGYFDWPRRVSLSEMSKRLNVPRTTLTYRIRKAERDVLNDILDL